MSYRLRDFGSYTIAGRTHEVTTGSPRAVSFTRSASVVVDPRGHFSIEHAYVQYFIPEARRPGPPVVLVHGGGMTGSTWETTPDNRAGWINLLVGQGYEVHVIDNVERGRAGFAPGLWQGDPILRSREEAWTLFRVGTIGKNSIPEPFEGTLFPVDEFDRFARMLVPRWLTTTPLHVAALTALLQRVGPAIVVCHSQGGEIALDALGERPDLFAALVAIEPSVRMERPETAVSVPTVLFAGDYLDRDAQWRERQQTWRDWVKQVNDLGGQTVLLESGVDVAPGHSHLPMLDRGSETCLEICLEALT